jgi:hypothetical protein
MALKTTKGLILQNFAAIKCEIAFQCNSTEIQVMQPQFNSNFAVIQVMHRNSMKFICNANMAAP